MDVVKVVSGLALVIRKALSLRKNFVGDDYRIALRWG